MYLGNQQLVVVPSVLHLTGQLTIAPPTAQLQQHVQYPSSYCQSQHPVQQLPQVRQLQTYSTSSGSERQHPQPQYSIESLEERIQKMEKLFSSNIQKVNEQTLQTYHLKSQIINRISARDQSFLQKIEHVAEIEQKSAQKSQQRMEELENKLEIMGQELEKKMEERMKIFLQEERAQAQKISQHKFQQLGRELKQENSQKCQQIQQMRQRLREIKTLMEEEKQGKEELEGRISERIQKEAETVEVLSNKILELQERREERKEKGKVEMELNEKRGEMEKEIERKKEGNESIMDPSTPYAKMFSIYANNITFMGSNHGYHQVLLDRVIEKEKKFVFNVQITHTANGCLIIGVVDRQTQRQQQYSHNSGNAVCCYGYGYIYYGKNGTYSYTSTGIMLETGMEVEVEVDLQQGTVKFIMRKGTSEWKHRRQLRQQSSDILTQPNRQFVPYFQMLDRSDCIRYNIK